MSAFGSRPAAICIVCAIVLLAGSARAHAQATATKFAGGGAGFMASRDGAIGLWEGFFGGERIFGEGVGVGGELAIIPRFSGFAIATATVSAHSTRKPAAGVVDPFVRAGFSYLFLTPFGPAALNVSGGVTRWQSSKRAVTFEVRDAIVFGPSTLHLVSFRVALTYK